MRTNIRMPSLLTYLAESGLSIADPAVRRVMPLPTSADLRGQFRSRRARGRRQVEALDSRAPSIVRAEQPQVGEGDERGELREPPACFGWPIRIRFEPAGGKRYEPAWLVMESKISLSSFGGGAKTAIAAARARSAGKGRHSGSRICGLYYAEHHGESQTGGVPARRRQFRLTPESTRSRRGRFPLRSGTVVPKDRIIVEL